MADNIELNAVTAPGGKTLRTKEFSGFQHELIINEYIDDNTGLPQEVSQSKPLPVADEIAEQALTNIAAGTAASLGQKTMAASVPVVLASNQSAINVNVTGGSGGAVTIVDGGDITEGAIADAAVVAGAAGTISAKLRSISRDIISNIVLASGPNLIGIVQSKDLPDSSATYALSNVTSSAYEASHVIKASAGYLYMVTGYNSKISSQFVMISNTASVPADGQTPVILFTIPPSSNFSLDLGKYGRYFSTGICIFNSSTAPTKTIGSGDCFFDCQFI